MNHVFTCVICRRQWDVESEAQLDCFFSGACCDCIQKFQVKQEDIATALLPLFESRVNVTPVADNLFHDPLLKVDLDALESRASSNGSSDIKEVFEYWKDVCKHPGAQLDKKRANAIGRQLIRAGRSVEDLKLASLGASLDPWAQNNHQDDIELICRDAAHVERFMETARRAKRERQSLSTGNEGAEQYSDIFSEIRGRNNGA